jgi:LysM repeat protein
MSLEVQTPAAPNKGVVVVTTAAPSVTLASSVAVTRTASPTLTATLTLQPINTIRLTNCSPRTDWATYIVTAGDTLGSIARRAGATVSLLAEANCLADANQIMAGQQLRIPYNSLDVPTPVGPPTPNGVRVGGQLTVSPVIGNEAGWLVLQAGSTITITWPRAEQLGAVEVNFTLSPPGTGSTPTYIGTDINTADGVSIHWTVPSTGTQGYLEATAGTLGGHVLVDQTQVPLQILAAPHGSGSVQIVSFTVSPNPVQRGGVLTLSWSTSGASRVQIERYSENGKPINESWGQNIPLNGSMTYALPSEEYFNHISFVLTADPGQTSSVSQRADTELVCPFATIFFGCPMTQQTINLIYQPFDRGYMFARRDTRKVYILYADNNRWEQFEDTWEGEPIYPSMPEDGSIPCGSSFRPYGALGKVWWSNNPIIPTRLGCGTSAQVEYTTPWEEHRGWGAGDTPITINVFHWPDGGILVLDPSSGWGLPPN